MLSDTRGQKEELTGPWIGANLCRVLQVCLEWGAGTLSSGDIADKVDTQEEWHQLEPAQKGRDAGEPPEPGLAG